MPNESVFIGNPVSLDISRSKFDLSHVWSGLCNAGIAVPTFAYSDVLPGDTFKISTQIVVRSTTPVAPVMDQLYGDIFYFFVPHKLVLGRESMSTATTDGIHSFEAFIGAQDSLLNMPLPGNHTLPKVVLAANETTGFIGSFADYIGINGYGLTNNVEITPFEALAYAKVWNDFFRDPNTMTPLSYSISSGKIQFFGGATALSGQSYINSNGAYAQLIQPACRFHGYFGSALPWPQRNSNAVNVSMAGLAPVVGVAENTQTFSVGNPLAPIAEEADTFNFGDLVPIGYTGAGVGSVGYGHYAADLSQATAVTVNAFRLAVQTQRWYEAIARSGNRLSDLCGLFGVRPHDIGSDQPEYLGGLHVALNMTQVANTAGTTYSTATQQSIGSTGAFSLTNDGGYICTKSFDTWGTIVSILVIRPHESFSQGIHRRFFRDDRLKLYWPQFANLGEQYIENREIYATGGANDIKPFGYQEAWAEYRMLPDVVTGLLRPQVAGGLKYWTYCNNFGSLPSLAGYLNGDQLYKNIDQTLQVPSTTAGFQFMAQVNHKIIAIRPMPTYSVPGLVDHH